MQDYATIPLGYPYNHTTAHKIGEDGLFAAKPLQELVLVMIFIHPSHRGDDPNQLDTGMSM